MTLNDLIRKAQSLAQQLSSGDIKLYDKFGAEIKDIELVFEDDYDEDSPYVIVEIR